MSRLAALLENTRHRKSKEWLMTNSKLLFIATVAISLISSLVLADESVVAVAKRRAEISAGMDAATANHTLQRTAYEAGARATADVATKTRARVAVELAADKAGAS